MGADARGQAQGDVGRLCGRVGHVQHFVTEGLDDPATAGGDDVGRGLLEALHDPGQLHLVEFSAEGGEGDQVGETDDERIVVGDDVLAVGHHRQCARGGRRQLAAPDVQQQTFDVRQQLLDTPQERACRGFLTVLEEEGAQDARLPVGEASHGLSHRPGETDHPILVQDTLLQEGIGDTQRLDVALGEDDAVITLGGKTQGSPDAVGEVGIDSGEFDRLFPGVDRLTAEEDGLDRLRVWTRRHTFSFT